MDKFLSARQHIVSVHDWQEVAMEMRLDKVTRKLRVGFRKVYSLVLKDEGLYIIRTGNVGALKHYDVRGGGLGGVLNQAVADSITSGFVKQLEAGEAQLSSTPLDRLAKDKGNAFVPRSEGAEVTVSSGQPAQMKLKTSKGDFSFVFTHTSEEQVQALAQALKHG
jgi:hypothetical protein